MRIVPSSTINLYSGVDIDMGEQLAFSSRAYQQAYFASKLAPGGLQHPCTMVRKTGMIRIEVGRQLSAATIKTCNYISFVNPEFDNKEVYARILDYDYVNNETVDIAYGIDYWQTWMFDVTFKDSYIEREHLSETLFNLAESNPYDIHIPEFRTAETLPINGETEKYYYDICPDTTDYLNYDGFKIGELFKHDFNVGDDLGILLKLSNIDFGDLDSTFSINKDNWADFNYQLVSSESGTFDYDDSQGSEVTAAYVDIRPYITTDDDFVRMQVVLNNGSESGHSINYIVGKDGNLLVASNDLPEGTILNPYSDGDYYITASMVSGYIQIKAIIYNAGFGFNYNFMTTTGQLPSKYFDDFLTKIQIQNYGFWRLPNSVYEYLKNKYHVNDQWGKYDSGPGWGAMTPYMSNDFRNECIYIYDMYGGTTDEILSELLTRLTLWNCVSSIVDMDVIPNKYFLMAGTDMSTFATWKINQKTVKTELTVTNKKLMLYPFSYLRVKTPNGDVKELHFEDFLNVRNGGDDCGLCVCLDISDKPILLLAPYQYKCGGLGNVAVNDVNIFESVFYKQFPTAPYNIDSYLAQVANYTSQVLKSNTLENLYNYATDVINVNKTNEMIHDFGVFRNMLNTDDNEIGEYLNGKSSVSLPAVAGAAEIAMNQYSYGTNLAAKRRQLDRIRQERNDVGDIMRGDISGAIGRQIALTRGAYAIDQYVRSNGVGTTNFNVMSIDDIVFMRVTLNNVMLERFDNYFTHYGYTSGRCGIPRVCAFVNGSSDNDALPHWLPVNGKPSTYIKTADCRVTHSMLPVENQIKAMFDSGVRMINGDPSTP